MTRLNLFFPQWQGAGQPGEIAAAAHFLKTQLEPELEFTDLLVQNTSSAMEQNIHQRSPLLEQLKAARTLLERKNPSSIFTLGGDCATALAPISYLLERNPQMAVLWFDAHGDLNTPNSSGSGAFHGMPVRHLLGEGDPEFVSSKLLPPEQLFMLGVRDLDPNESDYLKNHPISVFPVSQLEDEALLETLEQRGFTQIYLHLDLDVLEPSQFEALAFPVLEGLPPRRFVTLLERLRNRFEIVGIGLPAYRPFDLEQLSGLRSLLVSMN